MELFKNPKMKILISILWGLGLACIFRQTCKGRKCIVFKAPNPNVIKKKTYLYNKKCYKYNPIPTKCGKNNIEVFNNYYNA